LRADVTAVARYRPDAGDPLALPVYVVGGEGDYSLTRDGLDAWAPYAAGEFEIHLFAGDHFHVYASREPVIALVSRVLARVSGRTEERVP
jgi:surfactin synthase thioesterase subunit